MTIKLFGIAKNTEGNRTKGNVYPIVKVHSICNKTTFFRTITEVTYINDKGDLERVNSEKFTFEAK